MSKAEPTVQKYMTNKPISIDESKTLNEASKLMGEFKIRHLPVMKGETVTGIISDRDLKMISGIIGSDPMKILVRDLCRENLLEVEPVSPLRKVVQTMAENHYGSAIVTQNGRLVGIFTTSDACNALADIISHRYHSG